MKAALFTLLMIPALASAQQIYSLPSAGGEVWIDRGRILGTLQPNEASGGRTWIPHAQSYPQQPYGYEMQWGSGPQPHILQEQLSPYSGPNYWMD